MGAETGRTFPALPPVFPCDKPRYMARSSFIGMAASLALDGEAGRRTLASAREGPERRAGGGLIRKRDWGANCGGVGGQKRAERHMRGVQWPARPARPWPKKGVLGSLLGNTGGRRTPRNDG